MVDIIQYLHQLHMTHSLGHDDDRVPGGLRGEAGEEGVEVWGAGGQHHLVRTDRVTAIDVESDVLELWAVTQLPEKLQKSCLKVHRF